MILSQKLLCLPRLFVVYTSMGYFSLNTEEMWNFEARKTYMFEYRDTQQFKFCHSMEDQFSITSSYKHLTFSQDFN